jgi:hypothetical protein
VAVVACQVLAQLTQVKTTIDVTQEVIRGDVFVEIE